MLIIPATPTDNAYVKSKISTHISGKKESMCGAGGFNGVVIGARGTVASHKTAAADGRTDRQNTHQQTRTLTPT